MKTILLIGSMCFALVSVGVCRVAQAQVCTNCTSGSCKVCTVKVGIYGYTRPTWRQWPTTKEEKPGERKKIDRSLIRPEPFETPPPESEAAGVPERAEPDISKPPLDLLPETGPDVPPDLPPQLRNKQPIPIDESSSKARPRSSIATKVRATETEPTARPHESKFERKITDASESTPAHALATRPSATSNLPLRAQSRASHSVDGNPLRFASGTRVSGIHSVSHSNLPVVTSSVFRRAVSNVPVAVRVQSAPQTSANPLR